MSNALQAINIIIKENYEFLERWFCDALNGKSWPIYHSLDLRVSDYKICHVDSNLFPSGFHRLSMHSAEAARNEFKKVLSDYKSILIIIENFTKNKDYLQNVIKISEMLHEIACDVKIASLDLYESIELDVDGRALYVHKIHRANNELFIIDKAQSWFPDFILLNNDLTQEMPDILSNIEQSMLPNPKNGWHTRRKSVHFEKYNEFIKMIGENLNFNHMLLSTEFDVVIDVNFRDKKGLERMHVSAEKVLSKITHNYISNGISDKPYLFLKSDKGTFGMGVLDIQSLSNIRDINKKNRHSMNIIKGGVLNSEILIQEGIVTSTNYKGYAAENILYSVNGEIIGELIRYNTNKSNTQNLNSNGMMIEMYDFDIESNFGYIKWLINKCANLSAAYI